jgi:hypothetical protein
MEILGENEAKNTKEKTKISYKIMEGNKKYRIVDEGKGK